MLAVTIIPVDIQEQIMMHIFFQDQAIVDDHKDSEQAQDEHAHEQEVVAELLILEFLYFLLLLGAVWASHAFIVFGEEEHVVAIDHPPEFILLEDCEDQHFGKWLVVDWSIVENKHATDAVVDAFEESEEEIVDDPCSHRDSTVWLLDEDTGDPDE